MSRPCVSGSAIFQRGRGANAYQSCMGRMLPDLPALIALEDRVSRAKVCLQRTSEADPAFERRVRTLIRLVDARDEACSGFVARPLTASSRLRT